MENVMVLLFAKMATYLCIVGHCCGLPPQKSPNPPRNEHGAENSLCKCVSRQRTLKQQMMLLNRMRVEYLLIVKHMLLYPLLMCFCRKHEVISLTSVCRCTVMRSGSRLGLIRFYQATYSRSLAQINVGISLAGWYCCVIHRC